MRYTLRRRTVRRLLLYYSRSKDSVILTAVTFHINNGRRTLIEFFCHIHLIHTVHSWLVGLF